MTPGTAKKFLFEHSHYYPTTSATYIQTDQSKKTIIDNYFESAFDTLKQNNIFLLPDMRELKFDRVIHDGVGCFNNIQSKESNSESIFSTTQNNTQN